MAKKKREQSHAQKMLKQQKVRQEINERASDAYTQAHRVDARQGMATTVFTVESLDMKTTKNVFREGKKMKGIGSNNAHKKGVSTTAPTPTPGTGSSATCSSGAKKNSPNSSLGWI